MTLHRFEVFATVAKHKHVTHAARELRVSQPAVSHEIKLLEDAYGAVFIKRKSKGIELTPAGVAFRRDVVAILERVNRLKKKHAGGTSSSGNRSER